MNDTNRVGPNSEGPALDELCAACGDYIGEDEAEYGGLFEVPGGAETAGWMHVRCN